LIKKERKEFELIKKTSQKRTAIYCNLYFISLV